MYLHLLATSFPNLTLGGRKGLSSQEPQRTAQAVAGKCCSLIALGSSGGEVDGAHRQMELQTRQSPSHHPVSLPAGRQAADGVGLDSDPEGKPWEACQLSFQNQAMGEAEI